MSNGCAIRLWMMNKITFSIVFIKAFKKCGRLLKGFFFAGSLSTALIKCVAGVLGLEPRSGSEP